VLVLFWILVGVGMKWQCGFCKKTRQRGGGGVKEL